MPAANPLRWRNVEFNTTAKTDDPVWSELLIWSNETVNDEPLLESVNRTHIIPRVLTPEELENQTIREFEKLKVSTVWIFSSKAPEKRVFLIFARAPFTGQLFAADIRAG